MLGQLLMLFGFSFIVPIIAGIYFDWYKTGDLTLPSLTNIITPFLVPLCTASILGIALQIMSAEAKEFTNREAFFTVGTGWLIIGIIGALPFYLSRTLPAIDAIFESMSGFATCGASVIKDVEICPRSILMWRATTQWMGGMGIVALAVMVLSRITGAGGAYLYKAEVAGHEIVKLRPKLRETTTILWKIYAILTFFEMAILYLILLFRQGMQPDESIFQAVCHSFTTIATGGYSTMNESIAGFKDVWIEVVIMFFMIAGATNFMLHYKAMKGIESYHKDTEFMFFISSISIGIVFVTMNIWRTVYPNILDAIRYASFNVISIHTCTGYASADFAKWPHASQLLLLIFMLMGGCIGSTAGAIKVSRIIVLFKVAYREIRKAVNPRIVVPLTFGKATIPDAVANGICAFFFIYIGIFFLSAILMLLFGGLNDVFVAASAVATSMGGVGPGFDSIGPMGNFADITDAGKIILVIDMWLGRLEIYAPLMIFLPSTYRR